MGLIFKNKFFFGHKYSIFFLGWQKKEEEVVRENSPFFIFSTMQCSDDDVNKVRKFLMMPHFAC